MKLERQLASWQQAGLIDADTAARISAHENQKPARPYILYALGGLGALSVAIGLISIVAANWGNIGAQEKLALDLALLFGLAAAIFFTDRISEREGESAMSFAREALIFIYYGAVLASIGLVGQIYQLGGEVQHAAALWTVITLPFLLFARTSFIFGVFLIALQATIIANLDSYLQHLPSGTGRLRELGNITGVVMMPLLLIVLSMLPILRRKRPELCAAAAGLGITEWLITASVSQFVWYDRGHYANVENAWMYALLPVVTSAIIAIALPKDPSTIDGKGRRGLQLLLLFGPIFGYVPLIVHHDASGLIGAAGFLVLWSVIGWTALRLGRVDLFNLATAFLGMRLLGIYFELFGGLLNTGIGLLTGGLLTLFLAWLWVRLRRSKKKPPLDEKKPEEVKPEEVKTEVAKQEEVKKSEPEEEKKSEEGKHEQDA